MKNLFKGIMILIVVSLFGCTKALYTQDEVLNRYKTRDDVQKTFGIPTEKQVSDTSERWLYQYDRHASFEKKRYVELHQNTQTINVKDFDHFDRYLIFSFDRNGRIVRCDYTGVDLAVRKKDPLKTVALVAVCIGLAYGLAAIAANNISFY